MRSKIFSRYSLPANLIFLLILITLNYYWIISKKLYLLLFCIHVIYVVVYFLLFSEFRKVNSIKITYIQAFSIFRSLLSENNKFFYAVREGRIDNDYYLLKNKPSKYLLYIDSRSLVLAIRNNKIFSLEGGIHFIDTPIEIISTLPKSSKTVMIGPLKNEKPIDVNNNKESLVNFHLRQARFESSKSVTKDNQIIYSSIFITYYFTTLKNNKLQPKKAQSLMNSNVNVTFLRNKNEEIEKNIIKSVFNIWDKHVKSLSYQELIKEFRKGARVINDLIPEDLTNSILRTDLLKFVAIVDCLTLSTSNDYLSDSAT